MTLQRETPQSAPRIAFPLCTCSLLHLSTSVSTGVYVAGLSMHRVLSVAECARLMERGWSNRSTGATLMNADSSRSHSIFTIYIERVDETPAAAAGVRRERQEGAHPRRQTQPRRSRRLRAPVQNRCAHVSLCFASLRCPQQHSGLGAFTFQWGSSPWRSPSGLSAVMRGISSLNQTTDLCNDPICRRPIEEEILVDSHNLFPLW